ncbi:hypothetical protein [Parabacteroides sp. PF5-13]|nr:hypothetical protein [Parabacteroides sp. PF5-13]
MAKTIKIVKQNGILLNKEIAAERLESMLSMLSNGEYSLTISRIVKKRTLDQNRLMWLRYACIEKETETPKEDVHDYYCMKFLSRKTVINGIEQTITSGTSKLSTLGMKDFLDKVQADALTEFGIKLPDPGDLYWKEFEEYYKHFI